MQVTFNTKNFSKNHHVFIAIGAKKTKTATASVTLIKQNLKHINSNKINNVTSIHTHQVYSMSLSTSFTIRAIFLTNKAFKNSNLGLHGSTNFNVSIFRQHRKINLFDDSGQPRYINSLNT